MGVYTPMHTFFSGYFHSGLSSYNIGAHPKMDVPVILAECIELSTIINASITTVKRRLAQK